MKKYYNINYSLLVLLMTPTLLRQHMTNVFQDSMSKPLDAINNQFVKYMEGLVTIASSQVCYMQALLNDEFDFYDRRIKVRTYKFDFDSLILWDMSIPKRAMFGKKGSGNQFLLCKKGQIGANIPDFEIVFPVGFALSPDEERRLKQLVNQHKLATKKYIITNE